MLKSTLNINENVDISKYAKVIAFLKRKGDGYKPTKAKVFTEEEFSGGSRIRHRFYKCVVRVVFVSYTVSYKAKEEESRTYTISKAREQDFVLLLQTLRTSSERGKNINKPRSRSGKDHPSDCRVKDTVNSTAYIRKQRPVMAFLYSACAICKGSLAMESEFMGRASNDGSIRITHCGHVAHTACMSNWYGEEIIKNCPVCQTPEVWCNLRKIYLDAMVYHPETSETDTREIRSLEAKVREYSVRMEKLEGELKISKLRTASLDKELVREKQMADRLAYICDKLEDENDRLRRVHRDEMDRVEKDANNQNNVGVLEAVVTGIRNLGVRQLAIKGGYLYDFGEYTLLGDGLVYQILRTAFKDMPGVISDLTKSPYYGAKISLNKFREALRKLPAVPEKLVVSMGDLDTLAKDANDRKINFYVASIFELLYDRGARDVIMMPAISYSEMSRARSSLNTDLEKNYGPSTSGDTCIFMRHRISCAKTLGEIGIMGPCLYTMKR
ncbi:hypothetical protein U1Q18_045617 [Sarracenia purpurea var. burkii]